MIINYYITNAPTQAIIAYTTAMKQFGITFLPDVTAFYTGPAALPDRGRQRVRNRESGHVDFRLRRGTVIRPGRGRLLHSGRAGAHPAAGDVPPVRADQGERSVGLRLCGVEHSARPAVLEGHASTCWASTPIRIAAASGNDLAEVADRTRAAYQAGTRRAPGVDRDSVLSVGPGIGVADPAATPRHELDGDRRGCDRALLLGVRLRGLYEVKDPVEHAALYQELINVTTEIKSLEPVLLSPDAPVITANSAAGTVFTKTKIGADGTRYLFAYNYTAPAVTAEFTLAQPAASIVDYDTGVSSAPDTSTTFSGAFQPYQAHIFLVSNSGSTHADPTCATPRPTPTSTPTATPTATRTPRRPSGRLRRPRLELQRRPRLGLRRRPRRGLRLRPLLRPRLRRHARCAVNHAGEVEVRCSESRHYESSEDFEGDQRRRGDGIIAACPPAAILRKPTPAAPGWLRTTHALSASPSGQLRRQADRQLDAQGQRHQQSTGGDLSGKGTTAPSSLPFSIVYLHRLVSADFPSALFCHFVSGDVRQGRLCLLRF